MSVTRRLCLCFVFFFFFFLLRRSSLSKTRGGLFGVPFTHGRVEVGARLEGADEMNGMEGW